VWRAANTTTSAASASRSGVDFRYAPEAANVSNAITARSAAAQTAKPAAVHSNGNSATSSATSRGSVCRYPPYGSTRFVSAGCRTASTMNRAPSSAHRWSSRAQPAGMTSRNTTAATKADP
jgi:hypothetical protein